MKTNTKWALWTPALAVGMLLAGTSQAATIELTFGAEANQAQIEN